MTQWTPEAERQLRDYLARVDALSRANGDDADEIVEGLSQHIRAEAEDRSPTLVTHDQVQTIITSLGTPEQVMEAACGPAPQAGGNGNGASGAETGGTRTVPVYSPRKRTFVLSAGIAVPTLSLLFELYTGAMAEMYADPVPTVWHLVAGIALLVSIGLTDWFLGRQARSTDALPYEAVFLANAYATVLAAIYTAVYLPMLPVAVIALAGFGLGIMGFSPLFCLIAGLLQMRALYRLRGGARGRWSHAPYYSIAGAVIVVALGSVYAGPRMAAGQVLPMGLSEDTAERERGIQLIRTLHLEHQLLRACYGPVVRGIGPTRRWSDEEIGERAAYRDLYFRVTGVPYNAVPKPAMRGTFRTRVLLDDFEDWRVADSEVGGASVAGRVKGLSLNASNMDVNIMQVAAPEGAPRLAYIEWTIAFANASPRQREARAQIDLPHGGVASRLTLWIDGEEREAAFGGRDQVREAYQSVAVVQRRDPALLNVCGPDKVLLQCFPVQPNSVMKLKVGVTAPLVVRDGKAYLRLPYISERNFTIAPEFAHTVWVECDAGVRAESPMLKAEEPVPGRVSLRGQLLERDVQRTGAGTVEVSGAPAVGAVYAGALGEQTATMQYEAGVVAESAPSVCFVVDGSASMRDIAVPWDTIVQALPGDFKVCAVFAGGDAETFHPVPASPSAELGAWLISREYLGGCEQVPALVEACDLAGNGGTVIWVHGPMPVDLSSVEPLRQWERRRGGLGVRILAIEAMPGPNRVLEQCGDLEMLQRVPVFDSIPRTILHAVRSRSAETPVARFALGARADQGQPAGVPASEHLVRLAVNAAVNAAVYRHDADAIDALRPAAVAARLVTPVSGAVVLETQEQYARHGLDPAANEEAIPGVPEPHEWALLFVVIVALSWAAVRRRQQWGRA